MEEYGLHLAYLIAGFAGGVVTLVFVRPTTKFDRSTAAGTVLGGALVANYLTAVAQHVLGMPAAAELGSAFVCGICAIKIVKGIYMRGEKWEAGQDLDDTKGETP